MEVQNGEIPRNRWSTTEKLPNISHLYYAEYWLWLWLWLFRDIKRGDVAANGTKGEVFIRRSSICGRLDYIIRDPCLFLQLM